MAVGFLVNVGMFGVVTRISRMCTREGIGNGTSFDCSGWSILILDHVLGVSSGRRNHFRNPTQKLLGPLLVRTLMSGRCGRKESEVSRQVDGLGRITNVGRFTRFGYEEPALGRNIPNVGVSETQDDERAILVSLEAEAMSLPDDDDVRLQRIPQAAE